MASFDTFLNSFDPDSLTKGIQFEHFVKWFLRNDPEWSTQTDEVWLRSEYPDNWGEDKGVDLFFRHKNGEIWAVQAKCYSPEYSVTKSDMDKFLSESNRNIIDKRLLIATTDIIGKNAREVSDAQEKPVKFYLYSNFDKAAIEYPSSISELNKAKRKDRPTPDPHQDEAIKDVINGFESATRGQMIMACGTGKTYTSLWIKEELEAKTTLVLLPSLSLLSQTLWEWTFASNIPFEALCVCSDETVGKSQGVDSIVSSIQEVSFPTTSDPEDIKKFLKRDVNKVIFSTYHSSPLIAEAYANSNLPIFDLAIADEAHRCTGETGKAFTTVLDNSLIKAHKRLFTTATPRIYSSNLKKRHSEMGVDIADMNDELFFGKEFHNLTFAQAIDKDLLTDYRVVIVGVDEPMIADWIDRRQLVRTDKNDATDAKTLASQVGLIKAIKDYDLKRMISFHGRVKKAELFASEIHDAIDLVSDEHRPKGELYTDYVSGMMVSSKRRLKLSKLKTLHDADRGLLTNARCLSEGIDVPSLDGVAFIDPRSSQVDIIQAVGRAIRKLRNKPKEKAFGTIVLPVFIEETDDAEKSILSSNFKPIWNILNALKSHDETLSLELGQIRTNLGRQLSSGSASQSIPEKIIFDLPTTIDSSFADSLKTILIENTTDSWDFWFGLFQKYIENTNSLLIDNTFKTEGYALGNWVMAQRQRKKQGSLNQERIEKLNSLGFIWDVGELEWEEGIKHFIEFCESNNTHIVPQKHICDDGFTLGSWCNSRRQDYRTDVLKQSKINELNSIGFIWDVDQHKWNTEYENLKIFKKKYGHTNTTSVYDRENKVRLGKWCGHQRTAKKNKKLSLDRIKKLNQLDFIWELQTTILTNQWDKKYTLLEKYFEEKGDTYVDFRHSTKDGVKLGIFVATQRANRKKGLLSQDEIKKLDKLNFLWDVTEQRWLITYNELKKYTAEHGTAKVTRDYKTADGLRLGDWSNRQKYQNAINNLSKKRKDLLELLNGWDWIKTTVKEKK